MVAKCRGRSGGGGFAEWAGEILAFLAFLAFLDHESEGGSSAGGAHPHVEADRVAGSASRRIRKEMMQVTDRLGRLGLMFRSRRGRAQLALRSAGS
jgi:hypothetical protein